MKKALLTGSSKKAQFVRFGISGIIAVAVQYAVYILSLNILELNPEVSVVLSYTISFAANFLLSSLFTFRSHPNTRRALRFVGCHIINLGLQTGLTATFLPLTGDQLALLPAMSICVPINFFMVRRALS